MKDPSVPTEFDAVDRPMHYEGDGRVTCMDALESMHAGYDRAAVDCSVAYWCGCVLKYLWRWPLKDGVKDLKKAKRCLKYAIKKIEEIEGGDTDGDSWE